MIFFCSFVQQSFGISQLARLSLQHTTNPRIRAMSTKIIRTEHMNKWKPRALWTKVIFWGQILNQYHQSPSFETWCPYFSWRESRCAEKGRENVTSQGILGRPNPEWGLTQLRHPRGLWVDGKLYQTMEIAHFIPLISLARRVKLLHNHARKAVKLLHRPEGNFWLLSGLKSVWNGSTYDLWHNYYGP